MNRQQKIPYGISNFPDLVLQDYLYVDKTKYIEMLESYGEKYIFFLRPRRFGKSLFISLLSSYYDINTKGNFAELFDGLYIGANSTPLANSYYILHFNFSGIRASEKESLTESFNLNFSASIRDFLKRYNLQIELPLEKSPASIFRFFLTEVKHLINGKIYVLIDEYDHFANELLSFQVEAFEETISKTGFIRKWYEVLKIGTEMGIVDRIFATGVSPVTLDSLISGFNIASNLSRDPNLNEMMGFTEQEVVQLISEVFHGEVDSSDLLPQLKLYYNGYLFSEEGNEKVFNSDMILYYLNTHKRVGKPPLDLIDSNIASDYSKMQKLFSLKNQERNYRILEQILAGEPQTAVITREFSLAKEFTEEDFLSLLYYLGFLTIEKKRLYGVNLVVPNLVIKELYFKFFAKIISDKWKVEVDLVKAIDSIESLAIEGKIDNLLTLVEGILEKISNRDYINFDEKYIKILLMTYLTLSRMYSVKSEYEVEGGYIDLAILLKDRKHIGEFYEALIELKYVKKSDYDRDGDELVAKKLQEGRMQLSKYRGAEEFQGRRKMRSWVLVFVGTECVACDRID